LINKTAVVTGSGRGIGRETAILLCEKGLNVVICSRTRTEIDSTVEEIEQMMAKTNAAADLIHDYFNHHLLTF